MICCIREIKRHFGAGDTEFYKKLSEKYPEDIVVYVTILQCNNKTLTIARYLNQTAAIPHHAETKLIDGILYCNDRDWVESCTALIEGARGWLEIVQWTEVAAEHAFVLREVPHVPPGYVAA